MWICLFLTVNQNIIIAGSFKVYKQGILAWSFKYTSTLSSVLTSTAAHANKKKTSKHTDLSIGLNFVLSKKSQIHKPMRLKVYLLDIFCDPYSLSPFRISFECSDSLTGNGPWGRPLLIGPRHPCSHVKCPI